MRHFPHVSCIGHDFCCVVMYSQQNNEFPSLGYDLGHSCYDFGIRIKWNLMSNLISKILETYNLYSAWDSMSHAEVIISIIRLYKYVITQIIQFLSSFQKLILALATISQIILPKNVTNERSRVFFRCYYLYFFNVYM